MSDYIYAIEAKEVNKTFIKKNKKTLALKDFNIQIKKGSIHWRKSVVGSKNIC